MDPLIGGSLIQGGTSLINNALNSYSVKMQNKRNMENWREQTEYNTPANQRKRYEEAGMNPALAFGGGAGSSGNAAPPPSSERNNIDLTQIGSIISTYLDLKKKDVDIENTKTETAGTVLKNTAQEIENNYKESQVEAKTNILIDKSKEEGFRTGRGTLPADSPIVEKYENELRKFKEELAQSKTKTKSDKIDFDVKSWEFESDKKMKQDYDINPSDPYNVKVMKMLAKDMFNTTIEGIRDTLFKLFK